MFRFNFETAASSEAKPNGFAASINKTIYNLKVQRTIKLKTENFNRKNVRFILDNLFLRLFASIKEAKVT